MGTTGSCAWCPQFCGAHGEPVGGVARPRQLIAEETWIHTLCAYLHVSLPPKLSFSCGNRNRVGQK